MLRKHNNAEPHLFTFEALEGNNLGKRTLQMLEMQGNSVDAGKSPPLKRQKVLSFITMESIHTIRTNSKHEELPKTMVKANTVHGAPLFLTNFSPTFQFDERCGNLEQPDPTADISSFSDYLSAEEAAIELDLCVSLLKKYGVIKMIDEFSSQELLRSIPHPGFVGDGLSMACKTCGRLEDATGTLICDGCEEVFHMSCCTPRVTKRHFEKDDNWYCNVCRKLKRKVAPKLQAEGYSVHEKKATKTKALKTKASHNNKASFDSTNDFLINVNYNSKVRLGPAHQVDVLPWRGREESDELYSGTYNDREFPGMEVPLTTEEKYAEEHRLMKEIEELSSHPLPREGPENWLQCRCIVKRGLRDSDGRKVSDNEICGKWRRAPFHISQKGNWECFCTFFWDPRHADCVVPQELPTEEIMRRIGNDVK